MSMRSTAVPLMSPIQTESAYATLWFGPACVGQKPSSKSMTLWSAMSTAVLTWARNSSALVGTAANSTAFSASPRQCCIT